MARIFLPLSIIAIILIILTGSGIFWASSADVQQGKEDKAKAMATGVAIGISAQIEQFNRAIGKMAQDPEIIKIIDEGDALQIAAAEARMEKYLPGVLKIRLLRPGVNQMDATHVPHMGYADLDMVRETVKSNQMPAIQGEAGANRHLAITAKMVVDGRVAGVILASLSYDFILEGLKSAAAKENLLLLKQSDLDLAAAGDFELKGRTEHVDINVPKTGWVLQSWYDKEASTSDLGLVIGIITFSLLLLALAFYVSYRKITEMLISDQGSVLKAVKDLMTGNAYGNYPVNLSEMSVIISTLVQYKKVLDHQGESVLPKQDDDLELDGFFEESSFAVEEVFGDFLGSTDVPGEKPAVEEPQAEFKEEPQEVKETSTMPEVGHAPSEIFKAYDIRGIVNKTLTNDLVYDIGRAFGTEAKQNGCETVVIGRDGRNSSPILADSLANGLAATGCNVLDLGMVPTPVLYFVTQHTEGRTGIMVTGSHNPAEYNGLKMVIKGETLSGQRIQDIKSHIDNKEFIEDVTGNIDQNSMFVNEYIGIIVEDIQLVRPLKVVLDCGNGVAGEIGPVLMKTLGCEVIELFCDVDGNFPNHHPDPSNPDNLNDLIAAVEQNQADLGIAFDGDGDRLGLVDSKGKIIWPDRQMMLFAKDVLARKPGAEIIFDVKCSKHLPQQIVKYGGRPVMWKTGHSFMKAKLRETGAKLAGEMSGHIFFNDRWFGFDDALYAASRMIEILSSDSRTSAEVFAELPDSLNTPELSVALQEGENAQFIEKLLAQAKFTDGKITSLDGIRVDFTDGWGLVRASNTTPSLMLRFEADSEQAMVRIQDQFRALMTKIKPDIVLPF